MKKFILFLFFTFYLFAQTNTSQLKQSLSKIIKNEKVDVYYQKLYFAGKYKQIKKMYKYLKIIDSDYPKLVTARIYLWDGKYRIVDKILKNVKDKTDLNFVELKAYRCFYTGQYKCAKKYFSLLYNTTDKLEYAYRLIDIYIYEGNVPKTKYLVKKLLRKYPNDKKLREYNRNLIKHKKELYYKLKKNYEESGKFEDLQKLIYYLFSNNQKNKAYKLLEEYIRVNPEDINAKYWYAKYLSWYGYNKKAIKILKDIVQDDDYKTKLLIAKIYAWDGYNKKAMEYVDDVIENSYDEKFILPAKELKGLIYYWNQKYKKARPLLKEVLKYKFSNDAKEALMVMDNNVKPLIRKYKRLHSKNPGNLDYIQRVADYSYKIKDYNTAIKYYEKYHKAKPENLNIIHTLAGLYLIKKNYYKAFSYYEYWAYSKNDVKSLYELARNYYYAGFYKSALKVIDDILKKKEYKPAIKLRATLLKFAPKFTQNKQNQQQSQKSSSSQNNKSLLEMADRLYNNQLYDSAIVYYRQYLLLNPKDYSVREKYAYLLEKLGKYKEAAGEFFLLTWMKKDCKILSHYGYNLEKSGKKELAKKVYMDIVNSYLPKPIPDFLLKFINDWKKAWESQKISKYKKFYSSKYRNDVKWSIKKQSVFNSVKFISLYFADIGLIKHNKKNDYDYYKVKFFQQYTTNRKVDKGYKTLIIRCRNKKCLITREMWYKSEYKPIDKKCKELRKKLTTF